MKKLLIIEDDDFLLRMYSRKFKTAGFDVHTAVDGQDGLEKIKSVHPDLVLLDVMMPKLNGLEVLDKVKADEALKSIPIIMLTNLSSGDDSAAAIKKGALKYIVKSDLTPSQLVEKVNAVLPSK